MIYLGNGMYSDSGPNNQLMHYGVLGMRWGHRKAGEYFNAYHKLMYERRKRDLKDLKRSGIISRDQYKTGKVNNKKSLKLSKKLVKKQVKKNIAEDREKMRVNKGIYSGKKNTTARDAMFSLASTTPGYLLSMSKSRSIRNKAIQGHRNQSDDIKTAYLAGINPTNSNNKEQWDKIQDYYKNKHFNKSHPMF